MGLYLLPPDTTKPNSKLVAIHASGIEPFPGVGGPHDLVPRIQDLEARIGEVVGLSPERIRGEACGE